MESFGSVESDTVPCPSCISPSRHVTLMSHLPQQLSIAMLDQGEAVCVFSQGGGQLGLVYDLDAPVNLGAEGNQVAVTLSVSEPGAGVTLTLGDGEKNIQSQSMATVDDKPGIQPSLQACADFIQRLGQFFITFGVGVSARVNLNGLTAGFARGGDLCGVRIDKRTDDNADLVQLPHHLGYTGHLPANVQPAFGSYLLAVLRHERCLLWLDLKGDLDDLVGQ